MTRHFLLALAIGVIALTAAGGSQAATLLYNVSGYTLTEDGLRRFVGLEFDAGRVVKLHSSTRSLARSDADLSIDGEGAVVLPGLIDAHGHVEHYGRLLSSVDLTGVTSEAAAVKRVADSAGGGEGWITGRGWNQVLWQGKAFPTRASLDALGVDRPVVLRRIDGHAMWVNTAALERAGIDDATPDPVGGEIVRDAEGRATGVLIDNAMDLVKAAMPAITTGQRAEYLYAALSKLASFGLTSVHDARADAQAVEAYKRLAQSGRLPIRAYVMLDVRDPANDANLARGHFTTAGERLTIRSVKISADGALGSRGAALHADYSDDPGNRGLLLFDPEMLEHHINRSAAAGFQVNTHAIGDRANTLVLDLYEQLDRANRQRNRHRIEHAQVLRPEDLSRFAALDVIASVQPTHATSDKNMAGDRLGEGRLQAAYAWHSLLESGARMAGGSDFPVEHPNPFYGLYAAVTRQDLAGEPPGGWRPGEKLTREQALSLFTVDAAYAAHQEQSLGRLAPGYWADFILVQEDYFDVPENSIAGNRVLATFVAGEPVYTAPDAPGLRRALRPVMAGN